MTKIEITIAATVSLLLAFIYINDVLRFREISKVGEVVNPVMWTERQVTSGAGPRGMALIPQFFQGKKYEYCTHLNGAEYSFEGRKFSAETPVVFISYQNSEGNTEVTTSEHLRSMTSGRRMLGVLLVGCVIVSLTTSAATFLLSGLIALSKLYR